MKNQRGFVGVGVLIAILVGLAVLGGGAYYVVHQQSLSQTTAENSQDNLLPDNTLPTKTSDSNQVSNTNPAVSAPTQASNSEATNWQTYTNTEYGFEVGYPDGWKMFGTNPTQGIIFGRKDRDATYDGELYVMVDARSIAQLIQDQKTVEQDRAGNSVVETKAVTVNGTEGIELTVRNTELKKTKADWELNTVYFEKGGHTYVLSNGAIKSNLFDKFYKSFRFVTSMAISVPGMSKYTDTNFGFSFWYPSSWQVKQTPGSTTSLYGDGTTVIRTISLTDQARGISIDEVNSPDRSITIGYNGMGEYGGPSTFYFDPPNHVWMAAPMTIYGEPTPSAKLADVSKNTMGGLHIFGAPWGHGTYSYIVPLSAQHFLVITGSYSNEYAYNDTAHNIDSTPFVQTILASDPAVATPVSAAEQTQTVQAEKSAYSN